MVCSGRMKGLASVLWLAGAAAAYPSEILTFNDDGAWSWFQDERAIVHAGTLIIGSVAGGAKDASRSGDIELTLYDLNSGRTQSVELHHRLASARDVYDDHNSPALLARPDGRVVAVYSKHGPENRFYCRISEAPGTPRQWAPAREYVPSEPSRITYSNLHWLAAENGGKGRLYNFFRGLDNSYKPSYAWSDDGGETWQTGGIVIDVPGKIRHRPYVKYASNGQDTVHLFYTEGHPRDYDNSAYNVVYRNGVLHRSNMAAIRPLRQGLREPAEGTRIFAGAPEKVALVSDIHLDDQGRPYAAYSVQMNSQDLPPGKAGDDLRYRYARWDGQRWVDNEIAYAGSRLYAGEDDYSGNIALDPHDKDTVFISANVEPETGKPLLSARDGKRHYEIFRGSTRDGGATFRWTALTRNSTADHIRPVVPVWGSNRRVVLWLRGTYRTYTNYDLAVVGIVEPR